MGLLVDTGPLVALLDRGDAHHESCASLLSAAREPRLIPAPVLPEVDYLCATYASRQGFIGLLADVERGLLRVEELHARDYARVRELCLEYSDLNVGFVDAAVLAIVERLREPKLFTLDHRHFTVMRPKHVEALELLPQR